MGNTSACTSSIKELGSSGPSCASSDSEYVPAFATAPSEHGTTSSSTLLFSARSESMRERMASGEGFPSIEEQIEQSKCHWSEVAQMESDIDSDDEEAVMADNVRVFKELQLHPAWGRFFRTFGYDLGKHRSLGQLVVGEKIAEGGQAELYHVHVTWLSPSRSERDVRHKREWVLKVFKKGTMLRQLKAQWPEGYLRFYAKMWECAKRRVPQEKRHLCHVHRGTLLKDGRFAFLMRREYGDLRGHIDRRMALKTSEGSGSGPFLKRRATIMMYRIARGMDWLHNEDVIHRDLKASNVLINRSRYMKERGTKYLVADFECSVGVIGTGFFRAPEILHACKNGNVSSRPEVFTKKADVYSYGMTCYEILTGKLPFEGHSHKNYDLVLEGQRPKVPEYVDEWVHELLNWCWQSNPEARPTFREIMQVFESNPTTKNIRICD